MLIRYLSLLLCIIVHGVHSVINNDLTFREKAERYMSEYPFCTSISITINRIEYKIKQLIY